MAQVLPVSEYEALWKEGWDVTRALILEIKGKAEETGAKFAMVSIPSDFQAATGVQERIRSRFPQLKIDPTRGDRALADFGAQNSVPVFDILTPLLAARKAGQTDLHYTLFDSHMKPVAHKIMAKSLARQLMETNLLPAN